VTTLELTDDIHRAHHDLRREILSIVDLLKGLPDLEPGPAVDPVFSRLVRLCVSRPRAESELVLADAAIQAVRPRLLRLCSEAEYRLERHWARVIAAAPDPYERLCGFPCLENYRQLIALELHSLAGVGPDPVSLSHVTFLGGGPLPLSAVLLGWRLEVRIDVVDVNPEATGLAAKVVRRLGLADRLRTVYGDAAHVESVADSEVVVLAALVGAGSAEKRRVQAALAHRMRPGSLLLARGAHGLRTLLYPAVDPGDLTGWTPLAVMHPFTGVVNSVLVAVRQ
jgi:nicotianamine synthase